RGEGHADLAAGRNGAVGRVAVVAADEEPTAAAGRRHGGDAGLDGRSRRRELRVAHREGRSTRDRHETCEESLHVVTLSELGENCVHAIAWPEGAWSSPGERCWRADMDGPPRPAR